MKNPSKLATVMLQLFPMFAGAVSLSVKEIIANKDLILLSFKQFAKRNETKSVCVKNGKLYINSQGISVYEKPEEL